ncbi:MAG: LL-diaminopimelate aminotransferase [Rickettsia endosymbiont of Ixodes persulcatus]|nr:LL-diaminopimelate aminotransferase [Rickettsia endosymbiont of Ixodes persulcatus]
MQLLVLEINRRKQLFLESNPQAQLISLGIGDTTEPIPSAIAQQMAEFTLKLETNEGYRGYGPEQGYTELRQAIVDTLYKPCKNILRSDEIFVSDGAKCDIGRLQVLFGSQATIAVQDPSYPVYIDTSVAIGQSGHFEPQSQRYQNIHYLDCHPSNDFFPDLANLPPVDLIYFCSPNNPTGAVATHKQLAQLVEYAHIHKSIIIFDAAYSHFIQDPTLPRSIYEIPGAKQVAIELGSFSKMVGFTGVRLAWSVIPKELTFDEGYPLYQDWNRMHTTFFNGACAISQIGGLATLTPKGQADMQTLIAYYMENATLLKEVFLDFDFPVYGGINAPYLWVHFPSKNSWELFDHLLKQAHIICTPGCGFGPNGNGFVRLSAFGHRTNILKACERLKLFLLEQVSLCS